MLIRPNITQPKLDIPKSEMSKKYKKKSKYEGWRGREERDGLTLLMNCRDLTAVYLKTWR
jgi:hypothetical protein